MGEFIDDLPLDGIVRINWRASKKRAAFTEEGVYRGYFAGNPRRCAVKVGEDTIWIDRTILEKI